MCASHPCPVPVSAVSDIGLRLAEGIHDLKLEENLGPTRDAMRNAISAGSTGLFNTFQGVKEGVATRIAAQRANSATSITTTELEGKKRESAPLPRASTPPTTASSSPFGGLRPLSLRPGLSFGSSSTKNEGDPVAPAAPAASIAETAQAAKETISTWGAGFGSFLSSRASRFQKAAPAATAPPLPPKPDESELVKP